MSTLIFAIGNPSRGDDALGPLFVDQIEALLPAHPEWGAVELLTDFQLQVEHALDLKGRERVLFVDASANTTASVDMYGSGPFSVTRLGPDHDLSYSTHAMSPQAVLHVYQELNGDDLPPCWLLAIRGKSFNLGEGLSAEATSHLEAALQWTKQWLLESV